MNIIQLPVQLREGHSYRDNVRDKGFRDYQRGHSICPFDGHLDPEIAFKLWYEGQKMAADYFSEFKLEGAL